MIPEAYLEYEREAEARKRDVSDEERASDADSAEDALARRIDELLNTSKQTIQERAEENRQRAEAETDADNQQDDDEFTATAAEDDLEAALEAERARSSRAAKNARKREQKRESKSSKAKSARPPKAEPRPKRENRQGETASGAFVVFLVFLVFLVATAVILLGPLMRIDHVEVNDLKNMSEAQVEEIAGNPVGQNLLRFNTRNAKEELGYYPYVQDVQIKRHFPHWLEINVTEREPAGVLLNNGSYLLFSMDGVLLETTKTLSNQNLPLITGFSMNEVPSPGEAFKDNERFSDILKIVNASSKELLAMIQEINIKDRNNILAYTSQGLEIRIGNVDQIKTRMNNLNDIMNQVILSDIVEEPISAIDIRYEKSPVLVLEGYENIDATEYVKNKKKSESTDEQTTNRRSETANNGDGTANTGTVNGQTTGTQTAGYTENGSTTHTVADNGNAAGSDATNTAGNQQAGLATGSTQQTVGQMTNDSGAE